MADFYESLSAPLPEKAIQRTQKEKTRKGYDTTGYGYQFVVNRFNEAFGLFGWTMEWTKEKEIQGTYSNGAPKCEIVFECRITIRDGEKTNSRVATGGHVSSNWVDAYKGAKSNSFKKCAAMFGVGKAAFEGSIDEDNQDLPFSDKKSSYPMYAETEKRKVLILSIQGLSEKLKWNKGKLIEYIQKNYNQSQSKSLSDEQLEQLNADLTKLAEPKEA